MKNKLVAPLCLCLAVALTGCPQPEKNGSVSMEIDFNDISSQAKNAIAITSVLVEVSREGHTTVEKSLTMVDNVATGTVDNLLAGYWHIDVEAYSGANLLFAGETDVNIIAGTTVEAQLLFDPVDPEPTTGAVRITAGINPLPGYKALNQHPDKILFSASAKRMYVVDNSTQTIGVYSSTDLNRIHDISLDQAPLSIGLNSAQDGLLLGYPSGLVYSIDFATETLDLVGDTLMQVQQLVAINDQFVLVMGPGAYSSDFKTLNLATGQIVSTKNAFYSFPELLLNPVTHVVYGQRVNVSPTDIHRVAVNPTTGALGNVTDSRYHGDYALGLPIRFVNAYSRVCAASGNMFTSAEAVDSDLVYAGNLGAGYKDLVSDDPLGYIYLIAQTPLQKLIILNQSNFFVKLTTDLLGEPQRVFCDDSGIVVLTKVNGAYFGKVFSKTGLGL